MQNGLSWLSATVLNITQLSLKRDQYFQNAASYSTPSIPLCSSPKFLSETYWFILASLETVFYGRTPRGGGCCQSPDKRQRSDTALSEVCVWSLLHGCYLGLKAAEFSYRQHLPFYFSKYKGFVVSGLLCVDCFSIHFYNDVYRIHLYGDVLYWDTKPRDLEWTVQPLSGRSQSTCGRPARISAHEAQTQH